MSNKYMSVTQPRDLSTKLIFLCSFDKEHMLNSVFRIAHAMGHENTVAGMPEAIETFIRST